MPHRNVSDDALQDSAASLRMADGILRELVEAGAVDDDACHLAELFASTCDGIIDVSRILEFPNDDTDPGTSPVIHTFDLESAVRSAASAHHMNGAAEVLRLTEQRLEVLARLIEGAIDSPVPID